jgi:hypothetical protein
MSLVYFRKHKEAVCVFPIAAAALLYLGIREFSYAPIVIRDQRLVNNTKLSKYQQAYVHRRDDVCHNIRRHNNNNITNEYSMHEVSDDFRSFGKEALDDWSWLGNLMLLRQLLHEIARHHPETRESIHTRIDFCMEYEHSLVLPGGINIPPDSPMGKVPSIYNDGQHYLVISAACQLPPHDLIIQYSMPNIQNFRLSHQFDDTLLAKLIYVPPLEYEYNPYHLERGLTPITTFVNPELSRRHAIIQGLEAKGIHVANHNHIVSRERMKAVYDAAAIMLNIHQTPHHHTLEELRILPALMRGVIIISEPAPLTDAVPYSSFIVWSAIGDLPATITNVTQNYEAYFDRFFGPSSNLPCILDAMRAQAYTELEHAVLRIHRQKQIQ